MAVKVPRGASVRNIFEVSSEFHVRNVLRWKWKKSYGIRLLLTKVGSPTHLFVVSMTHSPKDLKWVSLCAALGIPHDDLNERRSVGDKLLDNDLLTVLFPGDAKKLSFKSARGSDDSPGPYYLTQMTVAQRKFLGGVFEVAITANDTDLGLLPGAYTGEDPTITDPDTPVDDQAESLGDPLGDAGV